MDSTTFARLALFLRFVDTFNDLSAFSYTYKRIEIRFVKQKSMLYFQVNITRLRETCFDFYEINYLFIERVQK